MVAKNPEIEKLKRTAPITNPIVIDTELYDDTPLDGLETHPPLSDALTDGEIEAAAKLEPLYYGGLALITGYPGCGKDSTGMTLAWRLKRYFGKPVILDQRPRQLFGKYTFFDEKFLMNEMDKIRKAARGQDNSEEDDEAKVKELNKSLDQMLQKNLRFYNCVCVFSEFGRYMDYHDYGSKMSRLISRVIEMFRHNKMLIIGQAQHRGKLQVKPCLDYVTYDIKPVPQTEGIQYAKIIPHKIVGGEGVRRFGQKAYIDYTVDMLKVRPEIGKQLEKEGMAPAYPMESWTYYNLFNSHNQQALTAGAGIKGKI
jgi:hypothetical protein